MSVVLSRIDLIPRHSLGGGDCGASIAEGLIRGFWGWIRPLFCEIRGRNGVILCDIPLYEREWLEPGSNRRHVDFQSTALPTELSSLGKRREIKRWKPDFVKRRNTDAQKQRSGPHVPPPRKLAGLGLGADHQSFRTVRLAGALRE